MSKSNKFITRDHNRGGVDFVLLKRDRTKEVDGKRYVKVWVLDATVTISNKENHLKRKRIKKMAN